MLISTTDMLTSTITTMLISAMFILTDARIVSIIQLRFFEFLLQLVDRMNFKRCTCTLEALDRIKMLQTPCWKEKDRGAACVGKIQKKFKHRKNCVVKKCLLTRCSFYKTPNFDLQL